MIDFFAFTAILGIAFISAAIGCFVVWRQFAYFGEALSHSALLGVALGLGVGFEINLSILLVALIFAVILVWLSQIGLLATDSLLGILSHFALAIGLTALHFLGKSDFELHDILLGDIEKINWWSLLRIYGGGALVIGWLLWQKRALVLMVISTDLAKTEGVSVFWINLLLVMMMAMVVAISVQLIGVLLVASLLIIPASAARPFSRSPQQMILVAMLLSVISTIVGFFISWYFELPLQPAIVISSSVLFTCSLPFAVKLKL